MPRQTFLFDIGKVLLDFDFTIFRKSIASGIEQDEALEKFLRAEQYAYESGGMSSAEFYLSAKKKLPFWPERERFTEAWNSIFTPNFLMWELAEKLASKGHRLILFSNTNALHAETFLKEYPVFTHFDEHHFSHEARALKPESAFYQSALEKFKLVPERTIYFDDMPENVAAGRDFGFHSFQYDLRNHQACLNWLSSLGIS